MESINQFADFISTNHIVIALYMIVVVVLVFLVFVKLSAQGFSDGPLVGQSNLGIGTWSKYGSTDSATNRGNSNIWADTLRPNLEKMVGSYEAPVTYNVPQVLDTYQYKAGQAMDKQGQVKDSSESFKNKSGLFEGFSTEGRLNNILHGGN